MNHWEFDHCWFPKNSWGRLRGRHAWVSLTPEPWCSAFPQKSTHPSRSPSLLLSSTPQEKQQAHPGLHHRGPFKIFLSNSFSLHMFRITRAYFEVALIVTWLERQKEKERESVKLRLWVCGAVRRVFQSKPPLSWWEDFKTLSQACCLIRPKKSSLFKDEWKWAYCASAHRGG